MTPPKLTPLAQSIVDEIRLLAAPLDAGRWISSMVDDGVNYPTPSAMNGLAALVTEYSVGWWNEELEDSPLEVIFDLAEGLTYEDGMNLSWAFRHVLFPDDVDYGPQYRLTGEGQAVRLLFEQPDADEKVERVYIVRHDDSTEYGSAYDRAFTDWDEAVKLRDFLNTYHNTDAWHAEEEVIYPSAAEAVDEWKREGFIGGETDD